MGRLALLSVSDKSGIVDLARELVKFDFEIISSGGTAQILREAQIAVTPVSDYTDSPEILGGRVKTLHPRIHGGILARKREKDLAELEANNIRPFNLVVVNLYPFEKTIAHKGVTVAEAIENIDIGGPAMIRAAAKNFANLTVLCDPSLYDEYLSELAKGDISEKFRQKMAQIAFSRTQSYDRAITDYFTSLNDSYELSNTYSISGQKKQTLRYGENPHQPAAWYSSSNTGWSNAEQLQGKELSYNNLVDLEAARRIISEFSSEEPAAAVLKHTNPCGVAVAKRLSEAYLNAFEADNVSAFGGIVALNQTIDVATANALTKTFLECVVAPGCDEDAAAILQKKSKLRILLLPDLVTGEKQTIKAIAGGFLVQESDDLIENPDNWEIVTEKKPTPSEIAEMLFAQKVVKHVKSNAIVVTKERTTVGIGAGQMNRVGAVKIALKQAANAVQGAILASDGFFPFDDSVRTAAAAGIKGIIQPGGSIRDKDSIAAANELGIIMALSGTRHFLH